MTVPILAVTLGCDNDGMFSSCSGSDQRKRDRSHDHLTLSSRYYLAAEAESSALNCISHIVVQVSPPSLETA